MIGGNLNNYDTFENLSSGLRLFDYSVDMRSINHQGLFFDNLSFSNFGYGLLPQSRLCFRLGYSRNVNTGPALTTLEGGTEPLLSENVNDVTNSYHMGADYRGLRRA
jgi:hypothetical protein